MNYHLASLLLGYGLGVIASLAVQVLIRRWRRRRRRSYATGGVVKGTGRDSIPALLDSGCAIRVSVGPQETLDAYLESLRAYLAAVDNPSSDRPD
ncbi:hypothetical protein [Leifsonia sp. TF02-11]|uniref:hypothetical protein n=1 Tax=Leifsonia sp. TF02-11 TaxID=2815212 RepID=UPI001AA0C4D6|nr:hypothetical protein [Leifsonia sp. TF02-11]MBO1739679.1 hypothetical protein [Leifsonia sp. TF02-11]